MGPFTTIVQGAEPSGRDKKTELGRENGVVYVLLEAHYVSNEASDNCSFSRIEQFEKSGMVLSRYESIKTGGYASANDVLDYCTRTLTAVS